MKPSITLSDRREKLHEMRDRPVEVGQIPDSWFVEEPGVGRKHQREPSALR